MRFVELPSYIECQCFFFTVSKPKYQNSAELNQAPHIFLLGQKELKQGERGRRKKRDVWQDDREMLPCRDVFHLRFTKRARLGQRTHTSFLWCETFLAHDVRKHLLQKA